MTPQRDNKTPKDAPTKDILSNEKPAAGVSSTSRTLAVNFAEAD